MTTTKKLFYENTRQTSFSATVLNCEKVSGGYNIILDRTLFYPEGGGQPADTGTLSQDGYMVNILNVNEKNSVIFHLADAALAPGGAVTGEIDWNRRFSYMQQHTGEHIVSGIIKLRYGFENVGFHMGAEYVTVDYSGNLKEKDVDLVENLANKAVYENIKVNMLYPSANELESLNYRSKKELTGEVRIVDIPGYDTCACCGIHCGHTGEIRVIKLLAVEKYKGGARMHMLCGQRAIDDYADKNRQVYGISELLSAKPRGILNAVARLKDENSALKDTIYVYKKELFRRKAEDIPEGSQSACLFEDGLTPEDLRLLCLNLSERAEFAAVFSQTDSRVYRYALASKTADVKKIAADLNAALNGRGGGQKAYASGVVNADKEEIENWMLIKKHG